MMITTFSLIMFLFLFFFFNDAATSEIYTLSLHDALPIFRPARAEAVSSALRGRPGRRAHRRGELARSEEHTSELQSRPHLVCRLLLEKKKDLHHPHVDFENKKTDRE